MKAYMHCITKHDIEHQFGCKKEMLKEFFDNAENNTEISVTGFISKIEMKVTILTATDTRLSNNIFSLFEKEGKCEIDDIVIFYKNGYRNYTVELVKKNDKKYSILKDLFLDPRHLSIYTNSESLRKALSLSASSKIPYPRNRIIFGAPGTGKSYRLKVESEDNFFAEFTRVTFHPNYTYSQFVGTYKPSMKTVSDDDGEKEEITYSFVPGPFLRVYENAVKNPGENYLLIIEEINRANVAAVFGDVFQLLDRKDSGESEYPVTAGEDIRKYLKSRGIDKTELSIPENMYIWATMNSADQGVFPMDTAFKRRWNFEYIGIDENEEGIKIYEIPTGRNKKVNWNSLRKAINRKLINAKINEDKLLGPYFISEKDLKSALQNPEDFIKLFKSKVLMYLFEDAAKMKSDFFTKRTYSEICKEFDKNGIALFNFIGEEKGEGIDKLEELEIEQKPAVPESASE